LEVSSMTHDARPALLSAALDAAARGWPVLWFNRPVALTRRMRLPSSRPTLAAIALGTAVSVGGAVYLAARRRSPGA